MFLAYLMNILSPQVKLDLADELQSAFPPSLRPYVQDVCVRATSYEQLKGLGDRLSGVPSAAALDLELPFGRNENLNLGTVGTFFRRAGLTERVRAVKYCCRSVLGTDLFPSAETPVSAKLWLDYTLSQPAAFWRNLYQHSLVELQLTVLFIEDALLDLKSALRCGHRICGTLRCLQVDSVFDWQSTVPIWTVTKFLAGLKLPCLAHLGFGEGIVMPFRSNCGWPQKESVPMLRSFGGKRKPVGMFGLGGSGVIMDLRQMGRLPLADMAAMADSALGPAIRDVHALAGQSDWTWEGSPAAMPRQSVPGFLASLSSMQQLIIEHCGANQLLVSAAAINVLNGLETLALGLATVEGDLTGPCLTQIVCLSLQTQLPTLLARPPPALTSILVPHRLNAVVPRAVLGIELPSVTEVVRVGPGAPRWKVSHESCKLRVWEGHECVLVDGLTKVVPFKH